MANNIFAATAPKCWSAGYVAIPCRFRGKEPLIKSQYSYTDNIPSAERQRDWLSSFPDANIAVLLGTKLPDDTILGALDVDVPEYSAFIGASIGFCPAVKKSPRGMTYFVRLPAGTKKAKLKRFDEKAVCDVLTTSSYTLISPSIHPSGAVYEWASDKALWEISYMELPYVE
jgi:hypothetical protein